MCPSANIIEIKDKLIMWTNDWVFTLGNRQQNLIL